MNFIIDPEYLTSVTVVTDRSIEMSEEEHIIMRLKGHKFQSITSIDHPKFTELREELGRRGFIYIERRWWNGDMVIKQFTLNDYLFKEDDKFLCAGALASVLKHRFKIR